MSDKWVEDLEQLIENKPTAPAPAPKSSNINVLLLIVLTLGIALACVYDYRHRHLRLKTPQAVLTPIEVVAEKKPQPKPVNPEAEATAKSLLTLKERMALIAAVMNHNAGMAAYNRPKEDYIYIDSDWTINRMPNVKMTDELKSFYKKYVKQR